MKFGRRAEILRKMLRIAARMLEMLLSFLHKNGYLFRRGSQRKDVEP
jgi:hypothetical protein